MIEGSRVALPYDLVCYVGRVDMHYESLEDLADAGSRSPEIALFAMAAQTFARRCGASFFGHELFTAIPDFNTQSIVPCAIFVNKEQTESFVVTTQHCLYGFEKAFQAKDTEEYCVGGFGAFNSCEIKEMKEKKE